MADQTHHAFKVGDRFEALLLGYQRTYRVAKLKMAHVDYGDTVDSELVIITRSGLVWTTHVCGALLDFVGRAGVDYTPSPAQKTWRCLNGPLAAGDRKHTPYAVGEK